MIRDGDVGLPTVNGYAYYRYSRSGMWRLMWKSPKAFRVLLDGESVGNVAGVTTPIPAIAGSSATGPHATSGIEHRAAARRGGGTGRSGRRVLHRRTDDHPDRRPRARSCFTRFYDAVVRSKDDPPAQVFLLGADSEPIRAEKSLYDLATWTRESSRAGRVAARHAPQEFLERGGRIGRSGLA